MVQFNTVKTVDFVLRASYHNRKRNPAPRPLSRPRIGPVGPCSHPSSHARRFRSSQLPATRGRHLRLASFPRNLREPEEAGGAGPLPSFRRTGRPGPSPHCTLCLVSEGRGTPQLLVDSRAPKTAFSSWPRGHGEVPRGVSTSGLRLSASSSVLESVPSRSRPAVQREGVFPQENKIK